MYKVGVLGAGTWGMAVARVLCNRHHSVMVLVGFTSRN